MLDKLGVIVLVVTLLSGLMVYDRYITAQGEVSPLGQILDYTGFSRFISPEILGIKKTKKSFRVSFEEFQAKLEQIQTKRNELIVHRQEILQQLMSMNTEMQQDAVAVYRALESKKQEMLAHEQEIRDGRQQLYDEMRQAPSQEIFLTQKAQAALGAAQKQLLDFQQADKQISREYQVFWENAAATESKIQEGFDQTSSRARELVQRLVTVTEQDLRDLMRLYRELAQIQKLLVENMGLNYQRLSEAREQSQRKQQGILDRLQKDEQEIFVFLDQRYETLLEANGRLFQDFSDNEDQLVELWQDIFMECRDFFNAYGPGGKPAADSSAVPATAFRAQSPKPVASTAQKKADTAMAPRTVNRKPQEYPAAHVDSLPRQSLDEQMRGLKEKARDQGFYDTQRVVDRTLGK